MAAEKRTVNTAKITIIITCIAVVSKALGFTRDAVLAHFYGSSSISDVFITTLSMPDILFELIANSITIGFVPIAAGLLWRDGTRKEVNLFASNVVSVFEILAAVFALFFICFAGPVIRLAAPGFRGGSIETAAAFLRIISLAMLFKTVSAVFGAYMQSCRNFIPVSMYGLIMDLVIIASIVLSVRKGYMLLPWGVLAGVFVQMVFAVICAVRTGFRYSWSFDLKDPDLKAMLIMFLPALAATGANQIIQLVNKGMATTIMEGGVTLISNANKMGYAAENIIVLSIAAVIYPILSAHASSGDTAGFKEELAKGLSCTFIIMVPLSAALFMYSEPVTRLLFGHGKYVDAVLYTSQLMKVYCLGITGLSAYTIMVRALYARKMVRQSAACAVLSLLINIALCFLLAKTAGMGLLGIALATSVTYTVSFAITLFMMYLRLGDIGAGHILTVVLKTACASIPMAALSSLTYAAAGKLSSLLGLILCGAVGVFVYFLCMYFMKVEEVLDIFHQIIKKTKQ